MEPRGTWIKGKKREGEREIRIYQLHYGFCYDKCSVSVAGWRLITAHKNLAFDKKIMKTGKKFTSLLRYANMEIK